MIEIKILSYDLLKIWLIIYWNFGILSIYISDTHMLNDRFYSTNKLAISIPFK